MTIIWWLDMVRCSFLTSAAPVVKGVYCDAVFHGTSSASDMSLCRYSLISLIGSDIGVQTLRVLSSVIIVK